MIFQQQLDGLVAAIPGARAGILMGLDGLALAASQADAAPVDAAAQLTAMAPWVRGLAAASVANRGGDATWELVVAHPGQTWVLRLVGPEHFAAVLLGPGGWPGRARFELKQIALTIAQALGIVR